MEITADHTAGTATGGAAAQPREELVVPRCAGQGITFPGRHEIHAGDVGNARKVREMVI